MKPMRVPIVAFCALVAAGIAWWWLTGTVAPPALADVPAVPGAAAAATPAAAAPDAGDEPVAVPVRTAVSPRAAPDAAARSLLVRGRCVAAENDAPLGGVEVRVAAVLAGDDPGFEPPPAQQALARGASGADGRFELRVAAPAAGADLRVDLLPADRAAMTGTYDAGAAGGVWDVGDVRFVGLTRVRGDVVDTAGAPVPDARVWLTMVRLDRPRLEFRDSHRATTDARGAFVFAAPVAAGEWYVGVDGTGAMRSPPTTAVPAGPEHVLPLLVERPDPQRAIAGRAVDLDGRPLAGVDLAASGDGAAGRAVSRADGTFTIHRGAPREDRGPAGVALTANSATHDRVRPAKERLSWGQRDVRVEMAPRAELAVRAIDPAGAVVRGTVTVAFVAANDALSHYPRRSVHAELDGAARIVGLRTGTHVLWFRPDAAPHVLQGPVVFTVPHAGELRVDVRPPAAVTVRVTSAAGPVANSDVELLVGATGRPVDGDRPAPWFDGTRSDVLRAPQLTIARGTTGTDGSATLAVAPGSYLLRVRGLGHLPVHRELAVAPGPLAIDVAVGAAAVLHGRLEPAGAVAATWPAGDEPVQRMTVVARAANGTAQLASAPVARDGTFTLGPLPAGAVDVAWSCWQVCTPVHAARIALHLGTVDVPASGGAIERTFAVGELLPGTVDGSVALDGAPLRKAELFLRTDARALGIRVHADDAGRFAARVPPGDWFAVLALPAQPGPGHVILPVPGGCTVRSGATARLAVDARVRTLRLVLRDANGAPLANARVRLQGPPGYARPGSLATDGNGVVAVAPAPYGAFTVVAGTGEHEQRFGPIDVPAAASEHSLELRAAPR